MSTPLLPSSTSFTHSAPSLLRQFEHYIQALLTDAQNQSISATESSVDNQETHHQVLWVIETAYYEQAKVELQSEDVEIIDIESLTQSPFSPRYELICFWLPTLSRTAFKSHLPTLMRSRDLDAEYTIIILDEQINLRPYGFVNLTNSPLDAIASDVAPNQLLTGGRHTDATDSSFKEDNLLANQGAAGSIENNSELNQLRAWQFNLFDYKPRPQWLNAHYWANPENWGKFRW